MLYGTGNPVDFHIQSTALAGTTALLNNIWYHIVGTYDGTTARLYVDGVEENSAARTPANPSTPLELGGYSNGAGDFDGKIALAYAYERALVASEVAFLYAHPYALITRDDSLAAWAAATAGGAPPAGLSIPIAMRHYMQMMGAA